METSTQKAIAIAELNPIVTDIAAFAGTIEGLDVTDEETQGQVGDLVKMMNHRRKKLEDKRLSLVKPLNGVVNEINALFKPPRDRIDEIIDIAKKKMNLFARAQAALANMRAKQAQEEAERERKEAEELAEILRKKAGQEAEPIAQVIVEEAEKKVEKAAKPEAAKVEVTRGQEASVIVTKTWKGKVVDKMALAKGVAEGRLPLNIIEPNMAAIQGLARQTKRAQVVDGIEIWEDVGTVVR